MTAKSKTERSRLAKAGEFPMTRVRRFFRENPSEILSMQDLCIKFDITKKQAMTLLRDLYREGVCQRQTMVCGKEAC